MNHFLEISQFSSHHMLHLVKRALFFKQGGVPPSLPKERMATLFYENSTRTRVSFELAAQNLAIPVVNFMPSSSSEAKGELIEDTFKTLAAMGISLFVIRHSKDGIPARMAQLFADNERVHIINAGDGTHAHPSQAMLDLMTIYENKPSLSGLKIAVVGNIRHSRVANSLQALFGLIGVAELRLVAPSIWLPSSVIFGKTTTSLQEGLEGVDVVICLRVQRERLALGEDLDLETYHSEYAVTPRSLAYAKPDAMLLHPGPINRGVEIDSEVADGQQSYVLRQAENGVFMRMAIIESLVTFFKKQPSVHPF